MEEKPKIDLFMTDYNGFASIGHKIITFLDTKTMVNCRSVCKLWKNFIDSEKVLILHLVRIMRRRPYNFRFGKVLNISIVNDNGKMLKTLIQIGRSENLELWQHHVQNVLQFACQMGKVNSVKSILKWYREFDIDLNARNREGRTALTCACLSGHMEVIQVLLEDPEIEPSSTDIQGWTPFMSAIARGQYQVVKMMLESERTQNIDFRTEDSSVKVKLIEHTMTHGGSQMFKLLLENMTINVNLLNEMLRKTSSLEHYQRIKVAPLLIETAMENDIAIATDQDFMKPIFSAICHSGHIKQIRFFLQKDFDVNIEDQNGRTPFSSVCFRRNIEAVQLFIEHATLKNPKPQINGTTPFYIACSLGHTKIVSLILQHSYRFTIDMNAHYNSTGQTPFHAACSNGHVEVVKLLLENSAKKGIDVHTEDQHGITPFFSVCFKGNIEAVQSFIEHATLKNPKLQINGTTAFYVACSLGHTNIVSLLLQHCHRFTIDMNALYNSTGQTALHAACSNGRVEVVKLLLENSAKKGIDINATDHKGNTPIQYACNIIKRQTKVFVPLSSMVISRDADPFVNIILLIVNYYKYTNFTTYDHNLVKECLFHYKKMKTKK